MKTTTIRELKHATTAVLDRVGRGETLEIQRHGRPVAVLSPCRPKTRIARPDFAGRLREIYGDQVLSTTGTDLVADSRGDT